MTQVNENEEEEEIPFWILSPIQRAYVKIFTDRKVNVLKKGIKVMYDVNLQPSYNRIKEIQIEIEQNIK